MLQSTKQESSSGSDPAFPINLIQNHFKVLEKLNLAIRLNWSKHFSLFLVWQVPPENHTLV